MYMEWYFTWWQTCAEWLAFCVKCLDFSWNLLEIPWSEQVYICLSIYLLLYIYIYISIFISIYLSIYIYRHLCNMYKKYINRFIYIHIETYIDIYTYINKEIYHCTTIDLPYVFLYFFYISSLHIYVCVCDRVDRQTGRQTENVECLCCICQDSCYSTVIGYYLCTSWSQFMLFQQLALTYQQHLMMSILILMVAVPIY